MDINTTKLKKMLNGYNIATFVCVVAIVASFYIIFKPSDSENEIKTPSGIKVVNTNVKEDDEITEEKARKVAVEQFKRLGERRVKTEQLKVQKILRKEAEYYYITSERNTLEIQIKGGKITRINSASVEEW